MLPGTPEPETKTTQVAQTEQSEKKIPDWDLVVPIAEYGERLRYKAFGEYIQDRFEGYHVGDDIEYEEENKEVPVLAITEGTITHIGKVDGYGGLIIVKHPINGKTYQALYGHLDLSSTSLKNNDNVTKGQLLANLGDSKSAETDGERKHLHFGLYEGDELRLQGYESSAEEVASWINPLDFFLTNGVSISKKSRSFEPDNEVGGDIFGIQFTIPEGWEVEYIPSLKALNLFTLSGTGTARARSQILIRYFDAKDFLTLSTVTIHDTKDLKIGTENYIARRYDIEKKSGIADFADQPVWRNTRHIVTDFREKGGFTRYYVVAANPALDVNTYESVLASMTITKDF
ncbi:MAG TPA: M23 family metallopeptidase [Candidatus Gracilibacteria bacterium]|nr:M23 family metallopeptidase [Candidatus Gracilibacteria bacterium]